MTTRPLPRHAHASRPAGARELVGPAASPIPAFALAFPAPRGHGIGHPLYEVRLAANRVYQARRTVYRKRSAEMDAVSLLEFVRQDVLRMILDEEPVEVGPFTLATYRYMDATKFRAWLPWQRAKAEELYAEFRRQSKKRLAPQDLGRY